MTTKKHRRLAGRTVAGALLVVAFAATAARAAEIPEFGPLAGKKVTGEKISIADLRGSVVVLNFWATWCQPCLQELPALADLARRYGSRGLKVVAASVDEGAGRLDAGRVAGPTPPGMQVWVGVSIDDMQRLGLGAGIPVTVVLDREGRAIEKHRGPIRRGALDTVIEAHLAAGEGKPGEPGVEPPKNEPKKLPGVTEASAACPLRQAEGRSL